MPRASGASGRCGPGRMPQSLIAAVRAPHLLAVHDVLVAVALGPRRQRGEVAAGARLAEQLAPHLLGREDRAEVRAPAARGVPNSRIDPPASTTPTMLMNGGTSASAHSLDPGRRCARA